MDTTIKDLVEYMLEGGTWMGRTSEQMTYSQMIECVGTMIREGYEKARNNDRQIRTSLAFGPR